MSLDPNEEELFNNLHLIARNDGEAYVQGDPKEAVKKAFRQYKRDLQTRLNEDYARIEKLLINELTHSWRIED